MFTVTAYDKNSLNYPFPPELMKTTQSDIIVVTTGNGETSKKQSRLLSIVCKGTQRPCILYTGTCRRPPCRYYL